MRAAHTCGGGEELARARAFTQGMGAVSRRFYVCYLLRPLLRILVRRGMPNEELNVTMCANRVLACRTKIGFLCQLSIIVKELPGLAFHASEAK